MTAPAFALARWLPTVGLLGWAGGGVLLGVIASQRRWSPGEVVLAAAGWVAVLAVVAREPVRNLFGPVFWYEVVRVGRRFTTFLFRFLYAGCLSAVLALMYLEWWQRASRAAVVPAHAQSQFAAAFFHTFAVVQYAVLLVLTPAYVAGAITDEKERKTIDYLFTTDLANREIVFGKLAARVSVVVLYVLAGLPLVAFLQLFGGIDPDLVLANTAAALVTAVGLSAVAVAVSAAAKRSRDAILAAYGLLLLYLVTSLLLPVLVRALTRFGGGTLTVLGWQIDLADVTDWYSAGNAFYALPMGTGFGRNFDPTVVNWLLGRYAAFWGVVSAAALGWAVVRLRAVALRQRYGGEKLTTRGATKRAARTLRPVGRRPLVWKEVFVADRRAGAFGVLFRVAVLFLLIGIPAWAVYEVFFSPWAVQRATTFAQKWKDFAEGMNLWVRVWTGVLSFFVFFGTALRAAGAVAGEKDRDTWVSLCTTPVEVGEFLSAKWLGAMLSMRFALGTLAFVWAVGVLLGSVYVFMVPVTLLFLIVFNSAFALAGVWCSISARTALIANVRAFFLSVLMAGGFWAVLLMCCGIPLGITDAGGDAVENLAILPLGATPPFVTGAMPMGSFAKYEETGPGPFHPANITLGPCAPVFGLVVWGVINLVLYRRVTGRLTAEMNRGPAGPDGRR
jgi:ABC-type transport system involved in multi-copper enzyme maturation permease subunit